MRAFFSLLLLVALGPARAAELFIRIIPSGVYEVTVDDQVQTNSKGKFRFFELEPGPVSVEVKEKNSFGHFYRGTVSLFEDKRLIVEIGNGDLKTIETTNTLQNYDFPALASGRYSSYHNREVCSESAFAELLEILKKERTDSSLVEKAKTYVPKANLSSTQVKQVCDLLSFDSSKLELARFAYDHVVDPGSYFVVGETFRFSSSKAELEKHIKNR